MINRLLICLVFTASFVFAEVQPDKTVDIPMRDGETLPADLYLPAQGDPASFPCILVRSPAGKKGMFVLPYAELAKEGYVVAIQDTRSVKQVKEFPYFSDGWGHLQDGYDTVEWLGKSPYCNGKVGTVGLSAAGITQFLLAPTAPPSLKSQYIGVAASSLYHHALYPGGQFSKELVEGWLGYYQKGSGALYFASTQPFYNDYWKCLDANSVSSKVQSPGFIYGGWYDVFLQGSIDGFLARQNEGGQGAKGQQKLVIGPWTHFWPGVAELGEFTIPEAAKECPVSLSPLAWFDATLKDKPKDKSNGVQKISPVTYYVMGPFDGTLSKGNVWRQADSWPPKATQTCCYLAKEGMLDFSLPVEKGYSQYRYHPMDPVPTVGGKNLFIESGPKNQSAIESREDVLVFTSKTLERDLEVTGRILAKIYVSADYSDTDIVVKLTDVYPDGKSILVADGIYRTATNLCSDEGNLQSPCEVTVDLWSTSMVFAKGHKLRVLVTSSNYPRFEKNHNTGLLGGNSGTFNIVNMRVWHGEKTPSRILLPVID